MEHALRLTRGAARERDQAGLALCELGGRGRVGTVEVLIGHGEHGHLGVRELREVALVGEDEARRGVLDAQPQVLGP